jgi:hypothetical protein
MQECRTIQRTQVLVVARIILEDSSVVDCAVRDLTSIGAGIEIPDIGELPKTFALTFDAGHSLRPCRLVWREVNRMGVEFLGREARSDERSASFR